MTAKRESIISAVSKAALRGGLARRLSLPFLAVLLAVIGSVGTVSFSLADSFNTAVDFTQTTTALAPMPFSSTISTYNAYGTDITQDAAQRAALGNLHAGYYRIPLQFNGGNVISSAAGGPKGISGDAWISSIKQFGGTPEIVLGGSADDNFTAADAAGMVTHFNKPAGRQANPVNVWVIGNEPDVQGMPISVYCTLFNSAAAAMKAVDPTIKVAGPAWSHFDPAVLSAFLQCAGNNLNILDFHDYAMGGNSVDTATALASTGSWGDEVSQAYQLVRQYAPGRGIGVQVGEYNWSWTTGDGYGGYQGDDRFYTAVNTVWGASVAGHIAAAGGRGDEYADLNGALGLTFGQQDAAQHYGQELNSPMPIYYGMEMFTGGNLFRPFGSSMTQASTTLHNTEIFAAGNGNIVMVNKDPAAVQAASIGLSGFSGGTADVWQTNASAPFSPPAHVATLNVANALNFTLPPYSVTTFVLNGGVTGGGPPTSTPTASSTPTTPATTPGTATATPGSTPTTPASTPATPTAPGSTPGTPVPTPPVTPTGGGAQQGAADACTGLSVEPGTAPGQYTFTVNATKGPGMTDIAYAFHFGDGTTEYATSDTVRHSYASPGTYDAWAAADFTGSGQNEQLTSLACQARVTVSGTSPSGGKQAPTPGNTCQALNVTAGAAAGQYLFTPWTTTAGGMTVTGYHYDFGDGSTQYTTDSTVTHSYAPGLYQPSVTVDFSRNGVTQTVTSPGCTTTVAVTSPRPDTVLSVPVRINAGGGPFVDDAGNLWQADQYYSGGSQNNQGAGHAIADTDAAPLFQDERWGNISYRLPIANGTYEVRLYFSEIYSGCLSPGCRVFSVTANGQPWLTGYDIAAHAGDYTADAETKTITVTGNVLDLTFTGIAGSPQVAAIEVTDPGTPQTTVAG
jgi:hypothetical protein